MHKMRPSSSVGTRAGRRRGTWMTAVILTLSGTLAALGWSTSACAQWPAFADPAVPRDAEGNVLMDAAPPRMPDGTPDFSGLWMRANSGRR